MVEFFSQNSYIVVVLVAPLDESSHILSSKSHGSLNHSLDHQMSIFHFLVQIGHHFYQLAHVTLSQLYGLHNFIGVFFDQGIAD